MRIRKWHRGSLRLIIRLRGHQVIGGDEEVQIGYQEMRGSATRCEEMRGEKQGLAVILRDTRRCEE